MKREMAIKVIGMLLYWGACLAAGCIYGIGAAVLVVVGAAFAAMVILADEASEGDGQCKINLEEECGKGEHEMWEDEDDGN